MDILNNCELLTDEYIGLNSKVSYYQELFISMQFMLEEVYEFYRKQIVQGKKPDPRIQERAAKRAQEVIGEMLDDVSVVSAIINYIDVQDDMWSFHKQDAALVFDGYRKLRGFIEDNAPENLKQIYEYGYEFLERTASKETLKWLEEQPTYQWESKED